MRHRAGLPQDLAPRRHTRVPARGFTLIELMITLTVLAVVMIVLTTVMYTAARSKTSTSNRIESAQAARVAVDMLTRDVRSAGFGADLDYVPLPQPAIAYVDSQQLLMNANIEPYPDTTLPRVAPLAYQPTGNPRPHPLNATTWTPPIKYRTGAEVVRWTLDVNNDGQVTSGDWSGNGLDALRTPNPNDYVLIREVWGDSTGNVAGNNGPARSERVALVNKPGGSVPPIFTVYFKGNPTPWNWASGPVPANQLDDIERVDIKVVSSSTRPDWRGKFAETRIETEVYAIRNVPNFGQTMFPVDGYIFEDQDGSKTKNGTEPGLSGVSVSLGYLTTTTNASGYFIINAAAGTYTLKHTPPSNYGIATAPDSFIVTLGPGTTKSFADTVKKGGWITVRVFEDLDKDNVKDASEPWRESEMLTLGPAGTTSYTNASGQAQFFAPVGAYTVTLAVPDSFVCTTSNPASGTMTHGGSASFDFAILRQDEGTLRGSVFHDKNGNGVTNPGEGAVENVWVGVRQYGSSSTLAFAYTDNSGNFTLAVPVNDPPATTPYVIEIIPPAGYFPTTPIEIGGIYVEKNEILSGYKFGLNNFQMIVLNSARVLSLASGDLIEKDWNATKTQDARRDPELILGADASGSEQVSVWFNQYNSNTLFSTTRSYSRTAPNSVLSLAADSLSEDAAPFSARLDMVTGTALAGAGNLFVWITQGTSGNEGYFGTSYTSAYKTADNGDVQAVATAGLVGGTGIDIVAGTKSPTAGNGTIEIWQSNDAASPTFTRHSIFPPAGNIPSGKFSEVTSVKLTDLLARGKPDLVVGTREKDYDGELVVLSGNAGGADVFKHEFEAKLVGIATAVGTGDFNGDNKMDIAVAVQTGSGSGELQIWRNKSTGTLSFQKDTTVALPGIPISLAVSDLGGTTVPDVAIGYRTSLVGFTGGVRIFYMDGGSPSAPVDPSGGAVTHMVPALNTNNFNFGVKPQTPPTPWQIDLAAGVKSSPTTGALVVFVR